MKTLEWRHYDKSAWGDGPWQDEPDKRQWIDEATGLPCLIVRNAGGALCGYVGVSKGHPCFEKSYDDAYQVADFDVHGGLTFSDFCFEHPEGEGRGICHVVEAGDDDHVWWLGFDCGHSGDLRPSDHRLWPSLSAGDLYCDFDYVEGQVRKLAAQLAAAREAQTQFRNPGQRSRPVRIPPPIRTSLVDVLKREART